MAQQMIPCKVLMPRGSLEGEAGEVARFDSDQLPDFLEGELEDGPAQSWQGLREAGECHTPSLPEQVPSGRQDSDGRTAGGTSASGNRTACCMTCIYLLLNS